MVEHAYLIALLPLAASLIIFFFGDWLPKKGSWLGILAIAASLAISIDLYMRWLDGSLKVPFEMSWPWFSGGVYPFEWGVLLDGPALILLLVVCTVSLMVQVYSLGYMHDAPRFKRFYAYLSLFTFSMLGLVLSNNYLQFFVGWELMGACSYFLISFEFERDSAGAAGNKAFLTTRLGDLGFYAALLATYVWGGTFNFGQIQAHLHDGTFSPHMAFFIAMMYFCGAAGKSAQVPFYVWLPDAMEGPTPVSALIHAATMVAAGIFLVARSYGFFMLVPTSLTIVAWVGGITAIFAASMALTASDIKRVLAYSTISQLGYMMMGLGLMGYTAGLFHLTTHAAFKALLFLGSGSVIHAVHTNDMWKMGSLSKQMITTAMTFFIGSLALAGIWPLAGFYSKEMILTTAFQTRHYALFVIGCITAFMTSFYMMRACALTFMGEARERDRFAHAHESPWSMTIPLIILAILSVAVGKMLLMGESVHKLLSWPGTPEIEESHLVTLIATGSALAGIVLGWAIYLGRLVKPESLANTFRPIHTLLVNKWYIDEIYWALFVRPTQKLSKAMAWFDDHVIDQIGVDGTGWVAEKLTVIQSWFDDHVVDGGVDGAGWVVDSLGGLARRAQTGFVQNYLLMIAIGFVLLVFWKIF
jgi:NADH-quinone oxidoreductase subunit L